MHNKINGQKVLFTGRAQTIDIQELKIYLSQQGAIILEHDPIHVSHLEEADIIIEGKNIPHLEDRIYELSQDQFRNINVIDITTLEKEFCQNLDIDAVTMAIKLSKDNERLLKLLKNDYFDSTTFLKLLKFYDWKDTGCYENDANRDVSSTITKRFCPMVQSNHNIEHSPIGLYYTALQTNEPKLLELLYNVPDFTINERNLQENQPVSLKETAALNPHSSKTLHLQILKNNRPNELKFLALNNSISPMIKTKLFQSNNESIISNLIHANNLEHEAIRTLLKQEKYKKKILKEIAFDNALFNEILDQLEATIQTDTSHSVSLVMLSSNEHLNTDQVEKLFNANRNLNIENVYINLLKNSNTPQNFIQEFLALHDKIYNIAIAHNRALNNENFTTLYNFNDTDVNLALCANNSTPKVILESLYQQNNENYNMLLSANENCDVNLLMQLQLDNRYATIVSNNETYRQILRNTIGMPHL
jgi:hypothetical protein